MLCQLKQLQHFPKSIQAVPWLMALLLLGFSSLTYAIPEDERPRQTPNKFYGDHARGWHWYEDPQEEEEVKPPLKQTEKPESEDEDIPPEVKELRKIQAKLQELREIAVMNPTHENMVNYMSFQEEQMERAQVFADSWRRALILNPELDRTIKHPTTQLANLIRKKEVKQETTDELKSLGKEYGIFFFFRGTCPYCHKFAPILANFSKDYGINVIPISLDGGTLPNYQNPQFDTNGMRSQSLGVKSVPTVFLVDPKKRNVIPLATGLIGREELENRVMALTKDEVIKEIEENQLSTRVNFDIEKSNVK